MQLEDYDRAKSLKQEIEVMRREVESKLQPYMDIASVRGIGHDDVRSVGGDDDDDEEEEEAKEEEEEDGMIMGMMRSRTRRRRSGG
jgi:hypothetical protein